MKKNSIRKFISYSLLAGTAMLAGCSKDESLDDRAEELIVSETTDKSGDVTQLNMPVAGGKDTLYIYSNVEFQVSFQTDEEQEWVTIDGSEYLSEAGATRLILNIQPLEGTYGKRSGMLSVSSKANYLAKFVTLSQGYAPRFTENFSWLKYGTADPFDETREVLIGNWSTAQKAYGWTSSIAGGAQAAYCYGRNDYVKLGSKTTGADLISPKISGLEKDSILLLTFNAVAYISAAGEKDFNKLTVTILEGGTFLSGSRSVVVDPGYYDYPSSLIETKMWDNSLHTLYIKKTDIHPQAATMQLRFHTGEDESPAARSRIFIDNVSLYTVHQQGEGNVTAP